MENALVSERETLQLTGVFPGQGWTVNIWGFIPDPLVIQVQGSPIFGRKPCSFQAGCAQYCVLLNNSYLEVLKVKCQGHRPHGSAKLSLPGKRFFG